LGYVVDNGLTTASRVTDPPADAKRNAIAHETGVDVTGARPGDGSGKRELFSESTATVLVFENGGVIRLAAEVVEGQLLFLTHRETKREVVAQVTRKRPFPTGNPYIELEFTEAAPGFWGVDIPAAPQKAEARATPAATGSATPALAAALRQIVEEVGEEPAVAAPAPNVAEVERLRQEVEALREQLLSMKQGANADASAAPAAAVEAELAATQSDVSRMRVPSAEAPPVLEKPSVPPPADKTAAAEESPDIEKAAFAARDLFPEVALDFSKADQALRHAPLGKTQARRTNRGGTLRLALLGAGLVGTIAGGAWYQGWLPLPQMGSAKVASSGPVVVATAHRAAAPGVQAGAHPTSAAKPDTSSAAAPDPAVVAHTANTAGAAKNSAPAVAPETATHAAVEPESSGEAAHAMATHKAANAAPVVTKRNERMTGKPETKEVAMASEAGATVPPRLIESVRAVPPRGFVTGNVVLDAVVDSTGHVKSMKVLSGPESLRNAAIEALKKYKYAPAMQNGKAVAGHVQATVQFWYEP